MLQVGPQKGYSNLLKTGAMQANLCAALMFFCSQEKPCPPAVQLSWKRIQGHYCISCKRTPTTSQDLDGCLWKAAVNPKKYQCILSPSAQNIKSAPPQPLQLLTPRLSLPLAMSERRGQPLLTLTPRRQQTPLLLSRGLPQHHLGCVFMKALHLCCK